MELTINHLKGYLGTKAKYQFLLSDVVNLLEPKKDEIRVQTLDAETFVFCLRFGKLHLYPLSSITEYREDLGFVPMVELFKTSRGCFQMEINERYIEKISTNEYSFELGHRIYFFALHSFLDCDARLGHNYYWKCYSTDLRFENKKEEQVFCQNILFDKLNEWHIDYQNLIKENLAIEIN